MPPKATSVGDRAPIVLRPSRSVEPALDLPAPAIELLAALGVLVVQQQPAPESRLVEVDEVAAALHVSRFSIYRWAAQGRIPVIRAGKKVRFELGAVIAALRSESKPQTPAPVALARARSPAKRHPRPLSATRTSASTPAPESHEERMRAAIEATRPLLVKR